MHKEGPLTPHRPGYPFLRGNEILLRVNANRTTTPDDRLHSHLTRIHNTPYGLKRRQVMLGLDRVLLLLSLTA